MGREPDVKPARVTPERVCVLDGLFVEPEAMRAGLGRVLVEDAVRIARQRGAASLEVIANPERLGFRRVGSVAPRFGPGPAHAPSMFNIAAEFRHGRARRRSGRSPA